MIFSIAIISLLFAIILWIYQRLQYFKDCNIPFVKSLPLLGAFSDTLLNKCGVYDNVIKIYNDLDVKNSPFFGILMFHKPTLIVNDPILIKNILKKDFNSFSNRHTCSHENDPLGYFMLFNVKSPLWKKLRGKMSLFFKSGNMKSMYYILQNISNNLNKYVNDNLNDKGIVELEMKELSALYATDVVATAAFGVDAKSLQNPNGAFRKAGNAIFKMTTFRGFEFTSFFMLPEIAKLFRFEFFSRKGTELIQSTIKNGMEEREKSGERKEDLIDILIDVKKSEMSLSDNEKLTTEMLLSQGATFFAGGFETSSATMSFALYEICKNPQIQQRLRDEIKEMLINTDGEVNYNSVMDHTIMPYLHQIVLETLRLYPVLPYIDRECTDPNGYSLEPLSDFKIPFKMPVFIPIFAIHRDEKHFPNPMKFDPDRFSQENKNNIKEYTFFPFGFGPRHCIGERFGTMQVKTGIVKIIKDFRLETTQNTPKEIFLEKKAFLVQSEKGLYLNLIKDVLYNKVVK